MAKKSTKIADLFANSLRYLFLLVAAIIAAPPAGVFSLSNSPNNPSAQVMFTVHG